MMEVWNDSLYGNYRNRRFTQIWDTYEEFSEDYITSGIPALLNENSIKTLYFLLYARYGNSTIASSDENQFKYKVFTLIFMYGPTWEKRLELQADIRKLKIDEIVKGSMAISNHSYNPSGAPNTQSIEILDTINEQYTNIYKRGLAEAYNSLIMLLETDVTAYFLDRFRDLFLKVVEPELPLWYITSEKDDTEED